jgi:hypothetical protein
VCNAQGWVSSPAHSNRCAPGLEASMRGQAGRDDGAECLVHAQAKGAPIQPHLWCEGRMRLAHQCPHGQCPGLSDGGDEGGSGPVTRPVKQGHQLPTAQQQQQRGAHTTNRAWVSSGVEVRGVTTSPLAAALVPVLMQRSVCSICACVPSCVPHLPYARYPLCTQGAYRLTMRPNCLSPE